ncbi:extracellular calcium-sensing receptor-like [Engystomops pustulosus]|uniref:extracellular calcium-sensing receptor-like n=1 Tax=Engystomops pustulosus TaxID=76066 RepID=UPI003AFA5683
MPNSHRLQLDKYLQLQTIRYAMKEINDNPNFLPNITLGFQIYDSCRVLQKELEGALWMITGRDKAIPNYQCQKRNNLAAFIGFSTSTFSILMAHILSIIRYPQEVESTIYDALLYIKLEISLYHSRPDVCGMRWLKKSEEISLKKARQRQKIKLTYPLDEISNYSFQHKRISHVSTSSLLSDRTQFPFFLRTAPSDAFQSKGLAQLMLHFQWTLVGMIADSNDYGYQGIQGVRKAFIRSGACVEFLEYVQNNRPDRNFPRIIQAIKKSKAKTIIIFASDVDIILMFEEFLRHNITGKLWVASEGWATSNLILVDRYSKVLAGTIGFTYSREHVPGLLDFIENFNYSKVSQEIWDGMFWEDIVGCVFLDYSNMTFNREGPKRNCTMDENLEHFHISLNNVTNVGIIHNLYNAIYVIAKAMHDLSSCRPGEGPFRNGSCSDILDIKPWQVLHYMKKVRVKLSSGRDLFFDENGDPPPIYDIVNWQVDPDGLMAQITVGTYNSTAPDGAALTINTSSIQWPLGSEKVPISLCNESCPPGFRKASVPGEPSCCNKCVACSQGEISNETDATFCCKCPWNRWPSEEKDQCLLKPIEFLSYEETLGITLASTSVTSSFVPIAILGLLICHKTTPIVRANNYSISCLLLICLSLCFLSSLGFIGYPQVQKCLLRQVAFAMVFALCVSCILAKTILVMIAFRATKPNSDLRRWASPQASYLVISMGSIIQFIICTIWLLISPPFPEFNTKAKTGVIVIECNEGSSLVFWFTLGYLCFLGLISCLVAFLARQLPDSFNEAKFITFSMLAFLTVWVSYIPASLSTSGKYTVAMEIFAIMSSTWAIICCLFFPKCYIILFHPHVNSRKHLLGKRIMRKLN